LGRGYSFEQPFLVSAFRGAGGETDHGNQCQEQGDDRTTPGWFASTPAER